MTHKSCEGCRFWREDIPYKFNANFKQCTGLYVAGAQMRSDSQLYTLYNFYCGAWQPRVVKIMKELKNSLETTPPDGTSPLAKSNETEPFSPCGCGPDCPDDCPCCKQAAGGPTELEVDEATERRKADEEYRQQSFIEKHLKRPM